MKKKAKKLIEICCSYCWKLQPWRNQVLCFHCNKPLSLWHVRQQLEPMNRSDDGGCYGGD